VVFEVRQAKPVRSKTTILNRQKLIQICRFWPPDDEFFSQQELPLNTPADSFGKVRVIVGEETLVPQARLRLSQRFAE
jgi:hypothetical protein